MKKIAKFFSIAAAIVSAASCNNVEYQTIPYVTFVTKSVSVNENVGSVDVVLASHNIGSQSVTATLEIVDGSAKNGTNISLSSPTVTFNGNEQKTVSLSITNLAGVYTGSLTCKLKLSGASDGVELGAFNTASVTIKDLDHPLAAFIGDWVGKGFSEYDAAYLDWGFTISSVDSDVNKLKISGFEPATGAGSFIVTINKDKKGFVIPDGTLAGATYSSYGNIYFRGFNAVTLAEASAYCDIEVQLVDGKLYFPYGFISRVSAGALERFSGNITLTKK